MKLEEKKMIEKLFYKFKEIENKKNKKDKYAENLINKCFIKQPYSIYYMIQTILIQETAIKLLNKKIEELKIKFKEKNIEKKSFLSKLFNYNNKNKKKNNNYEKHLNNNNNNNNNNDQSNNTFLKNALQTAVGVTGGVFVGNLLTNLFNKNNNNNNNQSEEITNIIDENESNNNIKYEEKNFDENNNFISEKEIPEYYNDENDENYNDFFED
ncbi:hypothetical protein C3B56_00305 [Candidatus Annandia adelgestsuga]|uniref:DUF2076 domain-containing protein n=1 Tax=Candidatus Annandia adelgestsuga TaxID=1302411 RepID=A0A3S9J7N2_9ENTR|nr:DUF2076 family protein [Candidatus Annandia adelgestsuga]AZP36388.1 hypothetical protein C3B56_00305 [Candidatus Annandia adelgestsuga]